LRSKQWSPRGYRMQLRPRAAFYNPIVQGNNSTSSKVCFECQDAFMCECGHKQSRRRPLRRRRLFLRSVNDARRGPLSCVNLRTLPKLNPLSRLSTGCSKNSPQNCSRLRIHIEVHQHAEWRSLTPIWQVCGRYDFL
jgi:hypothetical protein